MVGDSTTEGTVSRLGIRCGDALFARVVVDVDLELTGGLVRSGVRVAAHRTASAHGRRAADWL
jgi:hypothetical protein